MTQRPHRNARRAIRIMDYGASHRVQPWAPGRGCARPLAAVVGGSIDGG
jgi:hypothetical protein